jgi:hypothetical protein
MFTVHSNDQLFDFVYNHYTGTSASTGQYGFIFDALSDVTVPFGETILDHIKEKINTEDTLEQVLGNLSSLATLTAQLSTTYADEFRLIASAASEVPVDASKRRGSYLTPSAAKEYFNTIKSPVGRALQCLAYTAGLTPNDLLREYNGLRYLKDGVANVGQQFHANNTAPRTVNFDPALLNELDPEGELVELVATTVDSVNADNAGLKGLKLSSYCNGSGYTLYDLRNSHAVNLLNEGVDERTVADIQGCKKLESFKRRIKNFKRNAGIE